jgi:O-succinylbenzoate synthase
MRFRLQYRRYRLPLRVAVRTAHGLWTEREGVIVRLENAEEGQERPAVGYGEAAPIPEFGTETADEAEAGVRALGEWIEHAALATVPVRLGCLRRALAVAREQAEAKPETADRKPETGNRPNGKASLGVAALLPAGRAALPLIEPRLEIGFRVFKWKVGVADIADELALLDDVCAALPSGAKLRLDANGAWDRRKAERWLERCAERPVEFVEQPCFAAAAEGATARRKTDDLMLGLAGDYPTPLALDESLIGDGDVERWIGMGWPGVFVLKPSLIGDLPGALARLEKAKASVVFSSALETAIGAKAALREAFAWKGEVDAKGALRPRALGFGVWPLFAEPRFDGPAAAPFVRCEDVERIDAEAVWTALS